MRRFTFAAAAIAAAAAFGQPAAALPIDADATLQYGIVLTIGGGEVPPGLEVESSPDFDHQVQSALSSPDAVEDAGETTIIDGTSPAAPSIFSGYSSSLRNGGTEGGYGGYAMALWAESALDSNPGNGASTVAYSREGDALAQAQITTETHRASGLAFGDHTRSFLLRNLTAATLSFNIEGTLSVATSVQADGMVSFAESLASADLFFESDGPLDILFSALAPIEEDGFANGPLAAMSLSTDYDPGATGRLGVAAAAMAGDLGGGAGMAGASASVDFLLRVTLQAAQTLQMDATSQWRALAVADVPVPAAGPLLALGLGALALARRRRG
ncbi:hypothetical protein ACQ5SO_18515 [Rhodovulum sp. DZ06]|uniref:hypothetical protein n=1 Tax=Rhodovulum sp. DZ06 TaxID=3425126 RepID=UPI003D336E23